MAAPITEFGNLSLKKRSDDITNRYNELYEAIYDEDGLRDEIYNSLPTIDGTDFNIFNDTKMLSIEIKFNDDNFYRLMWDGNDFKDTGRNDGHWDYRNLNFMKNARRLAKIHQALMEEKSKLSVIKNETLDEKRLRHEIDELTKELNESLDNIDEIEEYNITVKNNKLYIHIDMGNDNIYEFSWDRDEWEENRDNDGEWDYSELDFMGISSRLSDKYGEIVDLSKKSLDSPERSNSVSDLSSISTPSSIDDVWSLGSPKSPETIADWLRSVGCDLDEYMENIKVLANKGSSSNSIILFGDLVMNDRKTPVAFKIVFDSVSMIENSLVVEQQIYINVTESMLNNFHTPHLTTCIGMVKPCTTVDIIRKLSQEEQKNFNIALSKIDNKTYNVSTLSILILGKSSGKTLYDYISPDILIDKKYVKNPLYTDLTSNDKLNILFQLLYTLRCFEKVGLIHNDLHMKNIFVDKLVVPEERIFYISDNVWVKIMIIYDTKIFDFDRGAIYHPSVERNFSLDYNFCQSYGQCNKFNSRGDLSSLLAGFIRLDLDDNIFRTFLKTCMDAKFFYTIYDRKFIHLNTFENAHGDFEAGPDITDNDVKSIAECLDKLVKCPDFIKIIGEGKSVGKVYTLPPAIKTTTWMPTTNNNHKSLSQVLDNKPVSTYLTNAYLSSINIDSIVSKNNLYENEFGTEYMRNSTLSLFKQFITRKNVHKNLHTIYMVACYVICLPFIYKFNENDMIRFLFTDTVIKPNSFSPEKLSSYISDIWNVFNSTLPITMIKV